MYTNDLLQMTDSRFENNHATGGGAGLTGWSGPYGITGTQFMRNRPLVTAAVWLTVMLKRRLSTHCLSATPLL
jgi:hypothetical protein